MLIYRSYRVHFTFPVYYYKNSSDYFEFFWISKNDLKFLQLWFFPLPSISFIVFSYHLIASFTKEKRWKDKEGLLFLSLSVISDGWMGSECLDGWKEEGRDDTDHSIDRVMWRWTDIRNRRKVIDWFHRTRRTSTMPFNIQTDASNVGSLRQEKSR